MKINNAMSHELTNQADIVNYILGGHGVVTLKSHTGVHHTYKFTIPDNRKDRDDTMFIYTLVGGDEWVYVGMYKNKVFKLTKASKFSINTPTVKGIYYMLKMMFIPNFHSDKMWLYHEGICAKCGRPLTNPISIKNGIGPVCMKSA